MLASGQVINGTYLVDRRLGSGGMAEVFLVTHARLPRQFALKLLRVELGERRDLLDRFRREAEILASVRSAHIVDVIDWDYTYDGQPFLAMEYLEGETLSALLHRDGALPVEPALDIFAQIGEGLCAAHAVGVVHRDLKPSNIFLDRHGGRPNFAKILDFGIAKLTQDARTPLTAQSSVLGTPGYMAPEQALGRVELVDHRADQFALAVILYEMLSGQAAFYTQGEPLYRTLERVIHEEPVPLLDSPVARALQRALSKDPEARYPSVRHFVDTVLQAHATGEYPPHEAVFATLPYVEPSEPEARRWRWPLLAVVLALGCVLAGWRLRPVLWGRPATSAPMTSPPPSSEAARPQVVVEPLPPPPPVAPPAAASPSPPVAAESVHASGEPAPAPTKAASSAVRPAARPSRSFTFSGVDAAQEKVLRSCAESELKNLAGLPSGVIALARSGALHVVAGPRIVYDSGLTACLRQAFTTAGVAPPREATIRVQVAHR